MADWLKCPWWLHDQKGDKLPGLEMGHGKRALGLCQYRHSELPGPLVELVKQLIVCPFQVRYIKLGIRDFPLKGFQLVGISNVETVDKNRGTGVRIRRECHARTDLTDWRKDWT